MRAVQGTFRFQFSNREDGTTRCCQNITVHCVSWGHAWLRVSLCELRQDSTSLVHADISTGPEWEFKAVYQHSHHKWWIQVEFHTERLQICKLIHISSCKNSLPHMSWQYSTCIHLSTFGFHSSLAIAVYIYTSLPQCHVFGQSVKACHKLSVPAYIN